MERMTENEKQVIQEITQLRSQNDDQMKLKSAPRQDDGLKKQIETLEQDLQTKELVIEELQIRI